MGRPKKVKRAYHRKVVQQTEEKVTPAQEDEVDAFIEDMGQPAYEATKEGKQLPFPTIDIEKRMPSLMSGDLAKMFSELKKDKSVKINQLNPEMLIAVKEEEVPAVISAANPQPADKPQMFHSLTQGQIEFEEAERLKKEAAKKQETDTAAQAKNSGKPSLKCPFCQHIQASLNSKDSTSAWCEVCGRCFQANWR